MRKLLLFILMLMPMMVCAEDFIVNGILYNILSYQDLTLAVAPVERGSTPYSGDIVIPSSVTYGNKTWTVIEIMDDAFGYNSNITSVTLPSTLKKIGKNAFYSCSNSLPIAIPDGVEYIGGYAFCGVKISGTLPKSLRELGDWAFSGATMESIVIPKHLKKILAMTFASIENAPVTFNDSLELIETNAFYQNKTFVNLVIPASVKSIGSAFQQCTNIETVQLPEGLLEFGSYHSLPKLYSINIPDSITRFQPSALANCPLIKDVHWPKFLSTIEGSAFKNTGLKIVRFPDKLYTKYYPTNRWGEITGPLEIKDNGKVSIGSNAFADCLSLDSVYITDVVSSISNGAFGGKTKLKAVVTTKEKPMSINQDVFSADTYLSATLYVPYNTSEEYKKATAWSNFSTIIELPKTTFTLVYIVDGEIYKTYEIKQNEEIIPEPAPTKEGYSFSGWSGLPETMPDHDVTVTGTFTINKYKLTYMVDDEVYKTYDVEYGATITPEAEPMKEGYTFSGWSEIPETMPAHDVLVKGSFTQSNSSVEIDGIFYNLNQNDLTAQVTQNPNKYSGDLVIPQVVKYNNTDYKVTSIEGPGLYTAGAFYQCTDLSSVQLPDGLVSIGSAAFRESGIKSIVIPESVVSIGQSAFVFCRNLKEITLSSKLSSIEGWTFQDCNQLTSIVIPEGVTAIANHVFANCIGLRTVKLPASLTSIGSRAFANCTSLKEIQCDAKNIPSTNSDTFIETFLGIATLYVPKDVVDKYKNTAPWSAFGKILSLTNYLTYYVDDEIYKSYEMEYGATITPEAEPTKDGYTFSGWSEIPETMPDHDVTVTGTFTINKHKLIYMVDGQIYKIYDVEYGATITPEPAPEKDGYTFSGWSEIPETMPEHDVTVTGTFIINKCELIYSVAGLSKMKMLVPAFEHNLNITAEEGWKVVTLTVNSEDKMGDLKDDILTINISAETEIKVTFGWADEGNLYTEDPATGIASIEGEGVKVQAKDGQIWVDCAEGKTVRLYTIGGGLMTTVTPSAGKTGKFSVASGTYIIQVGNKAAKVTVK